MDKTVVGIIGMGEMGKMYAKRISAAGWRLFGIKTANGKDCLYRVNACDKAKRFESLKEEFHRDPKITILRDGHLVSRSSDYILYSVEAEHIDDIVAIYAPSTKHGAIVGGQTSCKEPEMAAFEKHLPADVRIVSCHSLHGPKVDPKGQPLVIIRQRCADDRSFDLVKNILSCFQSAVVHLTAEQHDRITADTQAVTHAAFLSMGTAWYANQQFPWEINRYVGGIENIKCNIMLRIYSNQYHVYAGLAILNPWAKKQIREYAESVTQLFKLMLAGSREEFEHRVRTAGEAVFGSGEGRGDLLLEDDLLDQFSLGKASQERTPNNHLSLLAMVDCWWRLGIVPYQHKICSTPLFRCWLGATEYLFRKPQLLDEVLKTSIDDHTFRAEDLEFTFAARGWSECVSFGSFPSYQDRFERIQKYFAPRFPEATRIGNEMIQAILEKT